MEPQFVNKVSELNKSKQTLIIPILISEHLCLTSFKRKVFITSDDDTHTQKVLIIQYCICLTSV